MPSVAIRVSTFIAACVLFGALPASARAQQPVDLQLVLAVDVSASIDADEYDLQLAGLAKAFRDPVVQHAVRRTGSKGIAVAVVQWAGPDEQVRAIDWTLLRTPGDLTILAERIAAMPRAFSGDTRIGPAIAFAARTIADSPYRGKRRVIDVSGDGGAESLGMTRDARDRAVASGIVINGLPIEADVLDLADFYRRHVIGGKNAFVEPADDFADFARAMRIKLIREIGDRPLAAWTDIADNGGPANPPPRQSRSEESPNGRSSLP